MSRQANWTRQRKVREAREHGATVLGRDESKPQPPTPRNITVRPVKLPAMKPVKG